jgi:DNA invertase Pin-like site-specific DNA recombinase
MGRGTMRVAIYARVSTADQNPELQLRELRDYAAHRGFTVHREYVDQASGDVRRRKRAPAFDELMADRELARTSPLLHAHINPFGQYRFDPARMRRA